MLYRDTLVAHEWRPTVSTSQEYIKNERQWLLLGNKLAFLHVYIACHNFTNDSYIKWNEDLFKLITDEALVLRRQGFCTLAMGDFNARVGTLPGLEWNDTVENPNAPQFLDFIAQVNMMIINTLPVAKGQFTRFMDSTGSKSLLDYGLIDGEHVNNVTSFIIDEDARYACGSDHALLECDVKVDSRPTIKWKISDSIKYNIKTNTDYDQFSEKLDDEISQISHQTFSTLPLDVMLPHVVSSLNKAAQSAIGKYDHFNYT